MAISDLSFQLLYTSANAGYNYQTDLIFGNSNFFVVPEPQTWVTFLAGMDLLLVCYKGKTGREESAPDLKDRCRQARPRNRHDSECRDIINSGAFCCFPFFRTRRKAFIQTNE
jgi:hypothetical protein